MNKKVSVSACGLLLLICVLGTAYFLNKDKSSYDDYSGTTVNLDDYYEQSMHGEVSNSGYTGNMYVDAMIDGLLTQNGFSTVEILEDWDDVALNVHTYTILFDGIDLYYLSIDTGNKVFANPGDYDYYLEMNE